MSDSPAPAPRERARVQRVPARGRYEREVIDAILDEGLVAHVAFDPEHGPAVIPTAFWRDGDRLLFHSSAASRALRALRAGRVVFGLRHAAGWHRAGALRLPPLDELPLSRRVRRTCRVDRRGGKDRRPAGLHRKDRTRPLGRTASANGARDEGHRRVRALAGRGVGEGTRGRPRRRGRKTTRSTSGPVSSRSGWRVANWSRDPRMTSPTPDPTYTDHLGRHGAPA